MNTSGFNSQHEMSIAKYKPLIDARKINDYRRKYRFNWTIIVLIVVTTLMAVTAWMN